MISDASRRVGNHDIGLATATALNRSMSVADGRAVGDGVVAGSVGHGRLHQRVHGGGLHQSVGPLHGVDTQVGLERRPRFGPPF